MTYGEELFFFFFQNSFKSLLNTYIVSESGLSFYREVAHIIFLRNVNSSYIFGVSHTLSLLIHTFH